MNERRSFKGYDCTLKHKGYYKKEFVTYELTVENNRDIQKYLRGTNSSYRDALGICDSTGRMGGVCSKPDPEFQVSIKLPVNGLQALVRAKEKAKKERVSNVLIVKIRKDKDYKAIAKRIRETTEKFMPVKGMVKTA